MKRVFYVATIFISFLPPQAESSASYAPPINKLLNTLSEQNQEDDQKISKTKAIKIALEILRKEKSGIPDYDDIKVTQWGEDIMVTLVKEIPPNTLGSSDVISVILNSKTGEFIQFLGY